MLPHPGLVWSESDLTRASQADQWSDPGRAWNEKAFTSSIEGRTQRFLYRVVLLLLITVGSFSVMMKREAFSEGTSQVKLGMPLRGCLRGRLLHSRRTR